MYGVRAPSSVRTADSVGTGDKPITTTTATSIMCVWFRTDNVCYCRTCRVIRRSVDRSTSCGDAKCAVFRLEIAQNPRTLHSCRNRRNDNTPLTRGVHRTIIADGVTITTRLSSNRLPKMGVLLFP